MERVLRPNSGRGDDNPSAALTNNPTQSSFGWGFFWAGWKLAPAFAYFAHERKEILW